MIDLNNPFVNFQKIKPCPFCGYNHVSFLMDEHDNPVYPWYSQCPLCGAGAERGKTLEDAVNKWNKRVNQPVKHGYWIYNKNGEVRCSNCNALNCVGTDVKEMTNDINFCYNCGVPMNGEFEFQED